MQNYQRSQLKMLENRKHNLPINAGRIPRRYLVTLRAKANIFSL